LASIEKAVQWRHVGAASPTSSTMSGGN
jgi:hypothetical protein